MRAIAFLLLAAASAPRLTEQKASDYRTAAEQGDADAQFNLGVCYKNGSGVEKSYAQAVYWYKRSAEQGYAKSQYYLGFCCFCGEGITESYDQATYWWKRSAEQGYIDAQKALQLIGESWK